MNTLAGMAALAVGVAASISGNADVQLPQKAVQPDATAGLVAHRSSHTVAETIQRFEAAVREKGWMVVSEIDDAAAAEKATQRLRPRTVVVFGNPSIGTAPMQCAPMLAIAKEICRCGLLHLRSLGRR